MHKRGIYGLSLVEVLVSVAVLSILLAAFYSFYRNEAFALLRQHVEVNTKESAEIGLDFMLREIRMAGSRPLPEVYPPAGCTTRPAISPVPIIGCPGHTGDPGFAWITNARSDQITIQYDLHGATVGSDADGCPDDANELIAYAYDAANRRITRAADGSTAVTAVDNVPAGGLLLRYYRRNGPELVPPTGGSLSVDNIALIGRIDLQVRSQNPNPHPAVPAGVGSTEKTTIYMRNPNC